MLSNQPECINYFLITGIFLDILGMGSEFHVKTGWLGKNHSPHKLYISK